MKKVLFAVLLSVLLIVPCLAQTGTIAGKVTIEKSGNPLANAAVFLGDAKTGIYTQKDGSYILKNIPAGNQQITASFMGYKQETKTVLVKADETVVVNFAMVVEAVQLGGISVNATRAIKRETPIAFSDVSKEEIVGKYTTEDIPQLIEGVPGLFASTGGLGEGELRVRGFDQDKVQILINGIPVNDPESQQVYWSNWTGLSSNVKSVQVQRGSGSSMYGSGAFGGSINIETIGAGADPDPGWTFRTSAGGYASANKVADGLGNMVDYAPYNYNFLLRYNSGNLRGGIFNYSVSAERKVGDFYVAGTRYDGWSFGAELQNLWGNHKVNTSFISAPQEHNQARTMSDMALMDNLGRNYNRNNNPEQLNYYNKPQLSLRDEWRISDATVMMTNVFFSRGDGGGAYLNNDKFDVATGRVYFQTISESNDNKYFGRHARYIYQTTGVVLSGYNPADTTYNGSYVTSATNFPNGAYGHTWINDSKNNHKQFGFNTYLDHEINDMIELVVGGEWRRWRGVHRAESWDLRYSGGIYDQHEQRYNYDGIVTNLSGFARALLKPVAGLNIVLDGQYANYSSRVEENPVPIFDYGLGVFTGNYYYATKANFEDSDYEKTYNFLSPKFGINYNITDYLNVLANYSIAYKEPRVTDWYARSKGPDYYQTDSQGNVTELDPEKATTMEFGAGYEGIGWNVAANYFITDYEDKIESTYLQEGEYLTINAGNARHQGLELEVGALVSNFDAALSVAYGQNRWTEMNVEKIFGEDAEDIVDKVVPFSPEQMANLEIGYTFFDLPMDGKLRIGFSGNWWDEYYGNYTNEYQLDNSDPYDGELGEIVEAKLPYFLTINSSLTYSFKLGGRDASLKLDLKNLNNREDNYSRAAWTRDYGRNDDLNSKYYMYVVPAALFSAFLTAEVNF